MPWIQETGNISRKKMLELVARAIETARTRICQHPKRVLLLPPDITRAHSGAGWITEEFYRVLSKEADVHVIPTLGQHLPHTREQNQWMFGSIPEEKIHIHDWKNCVKTIGSVPACFVRDVSHGKADWEIPVSVNRMLFDEKWDMIINIGHVVPHEVLGFAAVSRTISAVSSLRSGLATTRRNRIFCRDCPTFISRW